MGALGAKQRRDPEPGMLDHIFLQLIACFDRQTANQSRLKIFLRPGIRPVESIDGTDSGVPLHLRLEFIAKDNLVPLPAVDAEAIQPLGQLAHLLPQGHPGDKILRPLLRRKGGIFIAFHIGYLKC